MKKQPLQVLVALVSVWSVSTHVHYVLPDGSSPLNCPAQPCLTLDQYTQHTGTYFTIGATFVFLAGNHSLQNTVSLTNISDMTLRGEGNDPQVDTAYCWNCSVQLHNVTNLTIEGLTLAVSVLNISSSANVKVSNCIFQGKYYPGRLISIINSSITVSGSKFTASGGAIQAKSTDLIVNGSEFIRNGMAHRGAAIHANEANLTISGCRFLENRAEFGGAIYIEKYSQLTLEEHLGNVFAHNSATSYGGAIHCRDSSIRLTRNCSTSQESIREDVANLTHLKFCSTYFHNNTSSLGGGALWFGDFQQSINGTNIVFASNKARRNGGAIRIYSRRLSYLQLSGLNILFEGNKAKWDGAFTLLDGENVEFRNNVANDDGGAIRLVDSLLTTALSVKFLNNTARGNGGAVAISARNEILIKGNFVKNSGECGGAVYIVGEVTLQDITAVNNTGSAVCIYYARVTLNGTNLINNTGTSGGGIYANRSTITMEGHTCIANNSASKGGGIYFEGGRSSLNGDTLFSHNTADTDDGGALYAQSTDITLNNRVNFTSNTAQKGGAMFISAETNLTLNHHTTLNISHNHAFLYGGSIYHEDKPTRYVCDNPYARINRNHLVCFLRLGEYEDIHINSYFDSADRDGSFLYGGLLDKCRLNVNGIYNYSIIPYNFLTEGEMLNIESHHSKIMGISSEPYKLCFFNSHVCSNVATVSITRGQRFSMSIKAVSLIPTSVPLTASTGINARIHLNQVTQTISNNFTRLEYNFYSSQDHDQLRLTAMASCGDFQTVIRVTLLPCPDLFVQKDEECVCDKRLLEFPNVNCTIDEYNNSYVTKEHGNDFWISVSYDTNGSYEGLILSKTCPAEYCTKETVNITLNDLDSQCDDNRGGVLCGQCLVNYSLMLGSSKCRHCSHKHLALLLPFAAAGIALVIFLSFLRFTVATGMINGVILYANILQVNRNVIFPANANNILTIFVAWMNLDLGFETCFYDGMTAYAQTWLQFAFPLYVWILISFIVLSSRYSITVSKLIGHNPIAVLATLLLMSHTKLLKIIIEVYSSADLEYPDNQTVTVWLKDANVPYLQSWHLLLTVVTTLVLVLFFLPYTFLLLLGHKLYRFAGRKYFRWIHRIRPLLESYYAPYNIHTRYWTGFLLLVRCVLYIIFAICSVKYANRSLIAINITFAGVCVSLMVIIFCSSHQLYTKPHNNILEVSTYLNLIVISAATVIGANSPALVYSLVGLVFVTMLGIIVYHFHLLYIVKSQVWQQFKVKVSALKEKIHPTVRPASEPPAANAGKSSCDPHKIVTHTEIDLREPLL